MLRGLGSSYRDFRIPLLVVLLSLLCWERVLSAALYNVGYVGLARTSCTQREAGGRCIPFAWKNDGLNLARAHRFLEASQSVLGSVSSEYGLGVLHLTEGDYRQSAQWLDRTQRQRPVTGIYLGYTLRRQGGQADAAAVWRSSPLYPCGFFISS